MLQEICSVMFCSHSSKHFKSMEFKSPNIASRFKPGQFLFIQKNKQFPYLRRAFSGSPLSKDIMEIFVPIDTDIARNTEVGNKISVLGPLGKGFEPPKNNLKPIILMYAEQTMALNSLARYLHNKQLSFSTFRIPSLPDKQKPCKDFPQEIILPFHEDLKIVLSKLANQIQKSQCFVATTAITEKTIWNFFFKINPDTQLSIERKFACGSGSCFACPIPSCEKKRYLRSCFEGPVFRVKNIDLS